MAQNSSTVDLIFNGIDRTGQAIQSVQKNVNDLADGIGGAAAPFAAVTKGILAMEAALGGLALAFAAGAYRESVRFESAQTDLAKVLSDAEGSVSQFDATVLSLSNTYGKTAVEVLTGITVFKTAGFTAAEAAQLVKNNLDLMVAGELEAAEASEILVRILKGFKADATEAGRAVDILNEISNNYATDVSKLAEGMAGISPIASQMGLSMEETAGILVPIIEIFQSGEEASTGLKTGLLALISDAKPVREALASIGVSQTDANGNLRAGKDILLDVAQAFTTLDENQKLFITSQIVGVDQSARMVEVFNALARTQEITATAMGATGSAAKEVEIRLKTAEAVIDRTAVAFNNLQIAIGNEFRTELTGLIDGFGELFRAFGDATRAGALDGFFDAVRPKLKELERIAREVAAALPEALADADYSGFTRGLDVLFNGLEDVEITADDLRTVIEGLGGTFEGLANFTRGVGDIFAGMAEAVGPLIAGFNSLDNDTKEMLGTIGGIAIVLGPAADAVSSLTKPLGLLGDALKGLGGLSDSASGAAGGLSAALAALRTPVTGLVAGLGGLSGAIGALSGGAGVGLLTYELGRFFDISGKLDQLLFDGQNTLGGWIYDVLHGAEDAAPAVGGLNKELAGQITALDGLIASGNKMLELNDATAETEADRIAINERLTKSFREQGLIYDATTGALVRAAKAIEGEIEILNDAEDAARGFRLEMIDGVATYTQVGPAFQKVTPEIKKTAEEMESAAERAHELQLRMLELATDERIALIEAKVQLDVAGLEAQTEQVKSAFESINTTISSTGETLASFVESLTGVEANTRVYNDIVDQMRMENERRDKAIELQEKLTDAQVENLQAKTRALNRGDALIKVSSEGLEPALEMVLWEVVKKIQIRANADGQEFLLGIN